VLKLLPGLENALEKRGVTHRTVRTEALEHAIHEAREAASEGEIPVVMSGDGLVGQVGGVLTGAEVPLGIIPGGRGNDLARVLGIPKDVEGAADVLAAGNVRRIDVGEVNGHRFVGIASCGFDSVANRIANEAELIGGNLVYLYAGLRTLATWRPARFTVTVDGRRHEFSGYNVAAANNKAYGGGMFLAPHAPARGRGRDRGRPAVRGIRRRRSPRRPPGQSPRAAERSRRYRATGVSARLCKGVGGRGS